MCNIGYNWLHKCVHKKRQIDAAKLQIEKHKATQTVKDGKAISYHPVHSEHMCEEELLNDFDPNRDN